MRTDVAGGAKVAIFARDLAIRVDTAGQGGATIVGALVVVVTANQFSANAESPQTEVGGGAGIAVITRVGVEDVGTAAVGVAGISCTEVAIVTVERTGSDAEPIRAGVANGASIAIVARIGAWRVDTSG